MIFIWNFLQRWAMRIWMENIGEIEAEIDINIRCTRSAVRLFGRHKCRSALRFGCETRASGCGLQKRWRSKCIWIVRNESPQILADMAATATGVLDSSQRWHTTRADMSGKLRFQCIQNIKIKPHECIVVVYMLFFLPDICLFSFVRCMIKNGPTKKMKRKRNYMKRKKMHTPNG